MRERYTKQLTELMPKESQIKKENRNHATCGSVLDSN